MKTLKYLFLFYFVMNTLVVTSQNKTNLQYSIGVPMGDTKEYISNTSFRGLLLEFEHITQSNIGIGIQFGWNTFYEEMPRSTYSLDNGAITSKQYRYINNIPIQLTGKYYFLNTTSSIKPFVGLGAGTNHLVKRTDNGLYTTKYKSWAFALTPKAGLFLSLNDFASILLSLDYNTTFKTSDISQQNWLGINIGFSWEY